LSSVISVAAVRHSTVAAVVGLVDRGRVCCFRYGFRCGFRCGFRYCLCCGFRYRLGLTFFIVPRKGDSAPGENDSESKDVGVMHLGFFDDGFLRVEKWEVDYYSRACCGRWMIAGR